MTARPDMDVAIIGGGPAGSSMAAYLARSGVKCTVFESELFPRPHVGESLVPSSTRVFRELDFLPIMEREGFPRKYGAAWTATNSKHTYDVNWKGLNEGEAVIRFDEREQSGVDQDYTYHVDRGRFDQLLLQHAHSLGARVHEGVRVTKVDFDDGPFPRVRYSLGDKEMSTSAHIVVDASGRRTLLGNQLKLRVRDDVFDQFAIHTWFRGYDRVSWARQPIQTNFIFIHFLPIINTWVWQIPITDEITSVGVVTQRKEFRASKAGREAFFWQCVDSRPDIREKLQAAEQMRPFSEEGDYSYAMSAITGNRWLMVGDAGRFVDPIFSTGVSIALNSSRLAYPDIVKALESGTFTRNAYQEYEATIRRGTNNWYNFISVYYRLNVLFTYFIINPKYRLDVLKLLQGDVYDEAEPAVLGKMREIVSEVERDSTHPWHELLNGLTGNAFKPMF